jgi:epoxyqueuosine reductase
VIERKDTLRQALEKEELLYLGTVGIDDGEAYARFEEWLSEGKHAGMEFLTRNLECRRDPKLLLPGAESVIVFGLPYFQGDEVETGKSRIAQYARFRDYHKLLREKAERAVGALFEGDEQFRVLVDSAPVLERALAARSERGFIGKNTCFIHPDHGSFLLLGELLVAERLPTDNPSEIDLERKTSQGGCGPCRLCQVHCPTGALSKDYEIDSNLCLSYWTIEHRGTIPEKFWPYLKDYVFGCDICQLVCPYNLPNKIPKLPDSIARREFPDLYNIATMSQADYERYFGGTPVTRAKREGLRRNALIALAMTGDPRLPEAMAQARLETLSPLPETVHQIERYLEGMRTTLPMCELSKST